MCLEKKNYLLILKKYTFYTNHLVVLGFVVSVKGVQVDGKNIKAIQ